jgi:glycosyltransferase involved in cell wall biosynthesis
MPLLATSLNDRGHTVRGTQYKAGSSFDVVPVETYSVPRITTPWWVGQWLLNKSLSSKLEATITRWRADVVVVGASNIVPGVSAAQKRDIPSVVVVPGLGFARYDPLLLDEDKSPHFRSLPNSAKIQYPFIKSLHKQYTEHLQEASEIIVISEFLKRSLKRTFGVESTVIHTPRPLDRFVTTDHSPQYLTMVNPRHEMKGADIFLKIAKELPEKNFAVAGDLPNDSLEAEAKSLDNMKHFGWVDDMRDVYRETELLLAPSRYQEGGGPAAVIEAFVNGIPAIGTNRGAIPEHIRSGGELVDDPDNINEWIDKIELVLANYATYSQQAEQISKDFSADKQIDKFENVIRDVAHSAE